VLGQEQFDRLVEHGRLMTTDEVARFIAGELSDLRLMSTEPDLEASS
jgi:hypothetical protein